MRMHRRASPTTPRRMIASLAAAMPRPPPGRGDLFSCQRVGSLANLNASFPMCAGPPARSVAISHRSRLVPPFALALHALLAPLTASAALPELDRSVASRSDTRVAAALDRLQTDPALRRIGKVAHVDERYGVP